MNEAEIDDFVEYWEVNLPESNYYSISLLDMETLDKSVKLTIDPEPDTLIRVILVIRSIDSPVEISTPDITTPEREGFVAVEWGVILQ
jgi:hypothetical protein